MQHALDHSRGRWEGDQYKSKGDLIAHEFLSSRLATAFPEIPVVSEEDALSVAIRTDEYFIIDPIDGTASFAQGYPGWVTQIAYVRHGEPHCAGIYAPATDEYFEATRAQGAYRNKQRLAIHGSQSVPRSLIDNYPEPRGIALDAMSGLKINTYLESGSIALKICRIADNTADLFIKHMYPRDWDLAAPMLILEESGGFLTNGQGERIVLGHGDRRHHGLIATRNPEFLKVVLTWLRSRE